MSKKQIYKPKPVSGFPEWLPNVRAVEQQWFDHIRRVFESYGFCSIETPSVEELDVLNAKSDGGDDVDKEVYVIERLHKEEGDKEARLALHFDQTVPLARYVAQHFNELVFPFKRYQMQRVWRGERPQAGRFREFYQCDIDVINPEQLPLHFDAEMPAIMWEVLSGLPGMENEKVQIRISNRKILMGFLDHLHVKNKTDVSRVIDKLGKLTQHEINELLHDDRISPQDMQQICDFTGNLYKYKNIRDMPAYNDMMKEGIEELAFVMDQLSHLPEGAVVADLSIVRGLDYYTGTVYETVFLDDENYGSICSGGRYDDLASSYINKKLPGVGISLGFSRLFARLVKEGKLSTDKLSPADVLVALPNEDARGLANETGQTLRKRGMNVEVYHAPQKIGKQMSYAEKKGIRYVWFPPFDAGGAHEVKDLAKGEQNKASPEDWKPDEL